MPHPSLQTYFHIFSTHAQRPDAFAIHVKSGQSSQSITFAASAFSLALYIVNLSFSLLGLNSTLNILGHVLCRLLDSIIDN